jgi:hypothetical protein
VSNEADPTQNHRRVSPEGKAMGATIALMYDKAFKKLRLSDTQDRRCKSCAFRKGTVPNGCVQTMMDVIKCLAEGHPFCCHSPNNREPCAGAEVVRTAIVLTARSRGYPPPKMVAPWSFSPPDAPEPPSE